VLAWYAARCRCPERSHASARPASLSMTAGGRMLAPVREQGQNLHRPVLDGRGQLPAVALRVRCWGLVCSSRRQSDPVVAHYLAALHHPVQRAQGGHVLGRVAVQSDQIGVLAGLDAADVVVSA
jgi:hypothetical protein